MSSICTEVWRHGEVQAAQKPRTAAHKTTPPEVLREGERNWWRAVRQITGHKQMSTEPLVGLAQRLLDGDVHALADHINKFFQQVAADLHPLSDSITPPALDVSLSQFVLQRSAVDRKLSQINIYKAPGPDGLPN